MPPQKSLYRNSTSFPALSSAKFRKYYDEYRESAEGERDAAGLKYYQVLVRRVMTDPFFGVGRENGGRGLLVYHDMGMGKTLLSVAIAMAMIDVRRPLIVAPKGLHKNFSAALRQYLLMARPELAGAELEGAFAAAFARFRFVSVDAYNMAAQVAKATTGLSGAGGSLEEHLLIVDEAHNLFRGVINSSKPSANARQLYEMVMAAKNLRLLFLTGTPVTKSPFELVPCFNMLAGFDLLPTDYERFTKLYVDAAAKAIRNRGRLGNRLLGLVSHVAHGLPTHPGASATGARDGFPLQLDTIVERVEMSPEQYRAYAKARLAEEKEGLRRGNGPGRTVFLDKPLREGPKLALPSASGAKGSTYHVGSRSVSNYAPPAAGEAAFAPSRSPKIVRLLENVAKSPGPVLVYSQFVSKGGLSAVAGFLSAAGFRRYAPASPPDGELRYAVISGQTPEKEREAIVEAFNAPANARGGVIRALLVSKTGAEGLDLKNLRQIHILEPYWDKARENQVIARGVRLGSHEHLPPGEREVRPFLYISTANPEAAAALEKPLLESETIDEAFHAKAVAKDAINEEFRALLRAVALECTVNGYGRCHFCAPTGVRLFQGDPAGDLETPEPCAPVAEKEVAATPFDYDGVRYFFSPDPAAPSGAVFYVFDEGLGGHRAVPPSSELFERLLRARSLEKGAPPDHGAM